MNAAPAILIDAEDLALSIRGVPILKRAFLLALWFARRSVRAVEV